MARNASSVTIRSLIPIGCSDLHLHNSSHFAGLLQSCITSYSIHDVRRVHGRLLKTQFSSEVFIQNRLIDAYAKCGCLDDAQKMFDRMPQKNTFTWNAMIAAYTKLGLLEDAAELFDAMPERDQCSWNSLVSGFAQEGWFVEALQFFVRMHSDDFFLRTHAFSSALSACAGLMDSRMGAQIHASISKSPSQSDVYMGSALVDMYSKCGRPVNARRVFDTMPEKNVVSWNSLITCYEQNGPVSEALDLFVQMMERGMAPDAVTLASVVSACAGLSAVSQGRQIHVRAVKSDRLRNDLILSNALVDLYSKCGRMNEARHLFDRMPVKSIVSETSMVSGYAKSANVKDARTMFTRMAERNIVAWNALIAGYTQNSENEEALKLFCRLKRESVWPTHYTFGNVLSACANIADLQLGRQTHGHVLKHGFRFASGPDSDIFVGNSLVDMYLKCGSVLDGSKVFEKMVMKDRVSWNAMIVGHAQNGCGEEALSLFKRMLSAGETPDHVTMIGVLSGCSHAGLVEEGRRYFKSMSEEHGLAPSQDHYTCMVDLLGRSGCLEEVAEFIGQMDIEPDAVLWGSLLAACRVHRNVEMGEWAAERLLELNPENSGPYVLLSNIYAEMGRWGDVVNVRKKMKYRGVVKQPGCSWIEIERKVYVFMVRDKTHPQKKEVYRIMKCLRLQMKSIGEFVAEESVIHD